MVFLPAAFARVLGRAGEGKDKGGRRKDKVLFSAVVGRRGVVGLWGGIFR